MASYSGAVKLKPAVCVLFGCCAHALKTWFILSALLNEIEILNVYDFTFGMC